MRTIIAMLLVLCLTGCNGQRKGEQTVKESSKTKVDTPLGNWKVRKEYDEFGNLIRYDSTYSWSYSNIPGDSIRVNLDSIMDLFQGHFETDTRDPFMNRFFYFPEADSLFMQDFFKEDYFFKNWERHNQQMEDFMRKMDSSRNIFLKRFHPGLMESGKIEE